MTSISEDMILQHPSLLAAHLASLAIRSLLLLSLPLAAATLRIGSCLATLWRRGTGRCVPFTTGHGERRLKNRARQRARSVIGDQVDADECVCIYTYLVASQSPLVNVNDDRPEEQREFVTPSFSGPLTLRTLIRLRREVFCVVSA